MKYRKVEYSVVQGIERQLWKWSVSLDATTLKGQAGTKAEAVKNAEKAIDRALAVKKVRILASARTRDD